MKYSIQILQCGNRILLGNLETPGDDSTPEQIDEIAFAIEQAINAHTGFRCHIETVTAEQPQPAESINK